MAFAISQLSRFNQWPEYQHHKAANQRFHYLFSIQGNYIYYKDIQNFSSFLYTSDVFLATIL